MPCPKFHSCEYTRARSELVPQAMKIANKTVRIHRRDGNNGELAGRFNEVFSATMEKLSAPLLRQSDNLTHVMVVKQRHDKLFRPILGLQDHAPIACDQ